METHRATYAQHRAVSAAAELRQLGNGYCFTRGSPYHHNRWDIYYLRFTTIFCFMSKEKLTPQQESK